MLDSCLQLDLFDFSPPLQLLLTSNRNAYALEFLKIDKPVKFVSAGEAPFEDFGLVLKNALPAVAGDAGVKRLGPVCHYVNVIPFF